MPYGLYPWGAQRYGIRLDEVDLVAICVDVTTSHAGCAVTTTPSSCETTTTPAGCEVVATAAGCEVVATPAGCAIVGAACA